MGEFPMWGRSVGKQAGLTCLPTGEEGLMADTPLSSLGMCTEFGKITLPSREPSGQTIAMGFLGCFPLCKHWDQIRHSSKVLLFVRKDLRYGVVDRFPVLQTQKGNIPCPPSYSCIAQWFQYDSLFLFPLSFLRARAFNVFFW